MKKKANINKWKAIILIIGFTIFFILLFYAICYDLMHQYSGRGTVDSLYSIVTIYFFYLITFGIIGFVCEHIVKEKGYSEDENNGFVWGFFLGIIGIIVCAVKPVKNEKSAGSADELLKYKQLLDEGVITADEFERKKRQLL